jgi:hypothetical protein
MGYKMLESVTFLHAVDVPGGAAEKTVHRERKMGGRNPVIIRLADDWTHIMLVRCDADGKPVATKADDVGMVPMSNVLRMTPSMPAKGEQLVTKGMA